MQEDTFFVHVKVNTEFKLIEVNYREISKLELFVAKGWVFLT